MKVFKIIILAMSVCIVALIGYLGYQYFQVKQTVNEMTSNVEVASPEKEISVEPFTMLLLGIDQRENEKGRSDTMILLSINPETGKTKMLSIPRDTRTEIVGKNRVEKINHAYAYGGAQMAIDSVENFLNVDVDYYATINMESFSKIIDTVAGITVQNDIDLTEVNKKFVKGPITLNGDEALTFSRIRHEDPRGDFGRQTRQRLIIEALMAKAKNPKIILKINDVMDIAGDSIKTNLSADDMMSFPSLYKQIGSSIDQLQFTKGQGETIDGIWYYVMDPDEVTSISNELNENLK